MGGDIEHGNTVREDIEDTLEVEDRNLEEVEDVTAEDKKKEQIEDVNAKDRLKQKNEDMGTAGTPEGEKEVESFQESEDTKATSETTDALTAVTEEGTVMEVSKLLPT